MTVTLHVPHPLRADVTRQLVHLAGGDSSAVAAATHGVTVSDELALAWLTATRPYVPNGTGKPVPTGLAADVRAAEVRAGIGDPDTRPPAAAGSPGGRARNRKTPAAPPEEPE